MENESIISRLSSFKKAFDGMIATSTTSYDTTGFSKTGFLNKYDEDAVATAIENGSIDELKELSKFYYYSSGFYRRIITYYATLLKYLGVLIPHIVDNSKSITDKKYSKKYFEASSYYDSLPVVDICTTIATKVLVEGAYYGMVKDYGNDGIVMQDLPGDFCRSRFKNSRNVDIIELDMKYFDGIRDPETKKAVLATFPPEIQKGYRNYLKNTQQRWVFVPDDIGVYFKLFEEKPFFINIIPAIISFKDYKEIEKNKDAQEVKKILVQKIPTTAQGEMVFEPEEAEEMHRGSVNMLKKNADIDVLTTYADVSLESMVDARQTIANNLEKIEKTIYSEAGVSKQLFAADGNLSMEKSLQNDLSLMMVLADKIGTFFSYLITDKFGDNKLSFKIRMLPISYYNNKEYSENAHKLAMTGYSFIIPALTSGITQTDLLDLKNLENELLDFDEILKPLKSSYTQSGKAQAEEGKNKTQQPKDAGGAPGKDEGEQSDKTLENKESIDTGGQ